MPQEPLTLVINPGSTTTKIAVYGGLEEMTSCVIEHDRDELSVFPTVYAQLDYRFSLLQEWLDEAGYPISGFSIIMGRGGLLHPVGGGVYTVTDDMLTDLADARYGEHSSNLGAPLAHRAAGMAGCRAYIADPVVVDELIPEARVSGIPEIERRSIFHALNQTIAAREVCRELGKPYGSSRLIVAHLGGGISIGAHENGRIIDVNNALDGEGPFSPERSGTLPAGDLVRLAVSGSFSPEGLQKRICGNGGLAAYLGTSDVRAVRDQALLGDEDSAFYLRAMIYQVSKEIGSLAAVLLGDVDAVILTGGLANSDLIVEQLKARVSFIAPVHVIPGEREMFSLAENALAVYNGEREARSYECIR